MEQVRLGKTGLFVSRLCLGTMTFGLQCDEAQSVAILDAAAEGGIEFLDTANAYPSGARGEEKGRTEEIIGRWLKPKRHNFILATKCVAPMGEKPWQRGMSRKHILDAVEDSLRRLQTDYIDLYQLHSFDPATPIDEALEALDTVVRQGMARYVGVSNWMAHRIARALGRSELKNLMPIVSVQPRYNMLYRVLERDLLPFCAEEGIAVIPFNPIAGGMLSGKYTRETAPSEGRFGGRAGAMYRERYWHEREFDTVEQLKSLAVEAGLTLASMAVAWVLANPAITSPIVGASRPEQLQDSLSAAAYPLGADLKARIDEVTHEFRAMDVDR
jgi:aryl-alcohol dehydrogenase-like predicted oxidoreductase